LKISDAGSYRCIVTNSKVPGLTIYSKPVKLEVADFSILRQTDSLALVAFYNSTGGPNWTNRTNWLSSEPISKWYGVYVVNERVVKLILDHNNLIGSIPPEIVKLDNLKKLDLWYNKLGGNIPLELCKLINLDYLSLTTNQFVGFIPAEIGNLVNLKFLALHNNNLSGSIPQVIWTMTNLEALLLGNNQLTCTLPREIQNLVNLNNLYLAYCNLSGSIPPELGNLANMQNLVLGHSQLSGAIPKEIGNLTNLYSLDLSESFVSGNIPKEIGNLINLEDLRLNGTQLSGAIPMEINNLTKLRVLLLGNSKFNEFPVLTMSSLTDLQILNNRFTYEDIEPNINVVKQSFTYSPQDSIGYKQIINSRIGSSFTFSVNCGGANNLYQWYRNNIIIPSATNREFIIPSLKETDAGSYTCSVTNTLVSGLTINSRPYVLNVELNGRTADSLALITLYNSTGGSSWTNNTNWLSNLPISEWYGVTVGSNGSKGSLNDTTSVIKLILSGNNLTGTLPKEIGNLTSLKTLNLDNNNLSGSVPAEINNLYSLQKLELSNNKLDELPELKLGLLDTLLINNNQFSFEDILPNLSVPNIGINYLQQDSIGTKKDTLCRVGSTIKFVCSDSSENNIYEWYKDGAVITSATNNYYLKPNLQEADSGSYTCTISNSVVPGLILYQRPYKLRVTLRTGINDIELSMVKVYPNPSGGIFYIEAEGGLQGEIRIIVTDIYGKSVFIKDFEDLQVQELNLEHLSKGIYFLRIQNNNRVFYQKIIIR
jgi:Leucine-rich repeat (LRR) protein